MTTAGVPTGYFNQTYATEFTVEGPLDGTTIGPPILDSPPTGANEGDPQGLFRRTVESLGLIDTDYLVPADEDDRRGCRGNRLITYLWVEGATAGAADARIDIVDAADGTPIVQKRLDVAPFGSLVGATRFFREGIFMPQGSMLRIRGMAGSAADPVKVRFHVQFLNNAEDLAAVLGAQCCLEEPVVPPPPVDELNCLGRFLVAKDSECAPFQEIADAYQALKDAGYGFGQPKGPGQCLVCPGDYSASFTMDTPGIDVVAVVPNPVGENVAAGLTALETPQGETRFLGNLTVDFSVGAGPNQPRATWNGIDIVPAAGRALHFTGADEQILKLQNCIVESQDDNGALLDNTFGASDDVYLDARNVVFSSAAQVAGFAAVGFTGAPQGFRTWNVFIGTSDPGGLNTIALNPKAGADVTLDNTIVFNQTLVEDSSVTAFDSFFIFDDAAAVDVDANSSFFGIDCKYQGTSGNGGGGSFISGSGFFVHDAVALFLDTDWDPALFVSPVEGIPQEQFWESVDLALGSFDITGQCNILAAGPPVPGAALLLPPAFSRPGPIRIIEDALASAGPVVLSADGLDLIVVGTDAPAASITIPPPAPGDSGGVFVISIGGGLWYVISMGASGAGGALPLDVTLQQFLADSPPLRFSDMPALVAQLGLLPIMASGDPLANRVWFGETLVGAITAGFFDMGNSDLRGGDPRFGGGIPGPNVRGQTFMSSGVDGVVTLGDPKRVQDLFIDAGPPGNAGPFFFGAGFPGSNYCELQNVTTIAPLNGPTAAPPFVWLDSGRVVLHRCELNQPGLEVRTFGLAILEVEVETDNFIGEDALQGTGPGAALFFLLIKGTGNEISPIQPGITLDVDIGQSALTTPYLSFSGADTLQFGCGAFDASALPGGTTVQLYPGQGVLGDTPPPTPLLVAPELYRVNGFKSGVLRGIYVVAESLIGVTMGSLEFDVMAGGAVLFTETILVTSAGTFASGSFGILSGLVAPFAGPIGMQMRVPAGGSAAAFDSLNVGVLMK